MSFARTCGAFAYAGFDRPGSWNGTRTSPSRPAGLAGRRSRCRRRPRTQEPGTLSTALIRPGIVPGHRPESRAVISCSSRPLPSGSPNERNEEQSTAAGFRARARACHASLGPGAMHHPARVAEHPDTAISALNMGRLDAKDGPGTAPPRSPARQGRPRAKDGAGPGRRGELHRPQAPAPARPASGRRPGGSQKSSARPSTTSGFTSTTLLLSWCCHVVLTGVTWPRPASGAPAHATGCRWGFCLYPRLCRGTAVRNPCEAPACDSGRGTPTACARW